MGFVILFYLRTVLKYSMSFVLSAFIEDSWKVSLLYLFKVLLCLTLIFRSDMRFELHAFMKFILLNLLRTHGADWDIMFSPLFSSCFQEIVTMSRVSFSRVNTAWSTYFIMLNLAYVIEDWRILFDCIYYGYGILILSFEDILVWACDSFT
jgi:hypothetical protein